jgi:hypothetical protein
MPLFEGSSSKSWIHYDLTLSEILESVVIGPQNIKMERISNFHERTTDKCSSEDRVDQRLTTLIQLLQLITQ